MDDKSPRTQGTNRGWFEDDLKPAGTDVLDREELKRRTRQAAESVGYTAPSESTPVPVAPKTSGRSQSPMPRRTRAVRVEIEEEGKGRGRPKGDRTVQMSVRIKQEHDDLIKAIAGDDFTVASIVEEAMVAFAKSLYTAKKYKRMPLDEKTLKMAKSLFADRTN